MRTIARQRPASARPGRAGNPHGTSVLKATQQIRELIVHGRLSPGSWLIESELCRRLGMSRTPVRSALFLLQREGFVVEQRNSAKSRMIVAPLTLADAGELYPLIGCIEGLAGRCAAELPRKERKEIADSLEAINERLEQIARDSSAAGASIFDLDHEFHRIVIGAGAGPRLKGMHQAVELQAERYWRLYSSANLKDLRSSVSEHGDVISALRRGAADKVEQALRVNWDNGYRRLAKLIAASGERGNW